MIGYRHVDPRYPFFWETADQPPGRWHGAGEGPTQYIADTPEGAWAEFLRHEGIVDVSDLAGVRRAIWAIDVPTRLVNRAVAPALPVEVTTGGLDTYAACQREARRLRALGAAALSAPSAALVEAGASGWLVDGGLTPGPARDGRVLALFGRHPRLVGWSAVHAGQPDPRILPRVRQLS